MLSIANYLLRITQVISGSTHESAWLERRTAQNLASRQIQGQRDGKWPALPRSNTPQRHLILPILSREMHVAMTPLIRRP